jgi:hypothetical protein
VTCPVCTSLNSFQTGTEVNQGTTLLSKSAPISNEWSGLPVVMAKHSDAGGISVLTPPDATQPSKAQVIPPLRFQVHRRRNLLRPHP